MIAVQTKIGRVFNEVEETRHAIKEMITRSVERNHGSHVQACDVLASIAEDLIAQLPKMKRSHVRECLYKIALKQKD